MMWLDLGSEMFVVTLNHRTNSSFLKLLCVISKNALQSFYRNGTPYFASYVSMFEFSIKSKKYLSFIF